MAGWLGSGRTAAELAAAVATGVLRTLGGDGAELSWRGASFRIPAFPATVRDTTAAGDCFVGVFASAVDRGVTPQAALRRASAAASIAVSKMGSQSSLPTAQETDNLGV